MLCTVHSCTALSRAGVTALVLLSGLLSGPLGGVVGGIVGGIVGGPALPASEPTAVALRAPQPTVIANPTARPQTEALSVHITVPDDAPADLGVTAYAADPHGRWHQSPNWQPLASGHHHLQWQLAGANLQPVGHALPWSASSQAELASAGIVISSASTWTGPISVQWLPIASTATVPPAAHIDGVHLLTPPAAHGTTGERWQLAFNPNRLPANPFDPEHFAADLVIKHPDGRTSTHPAFYTEPFHLSDGGDREIATPAGAGHFLVRWRPQLPGVYQATLHWSAAGGDGGNAGKVPLPAITVSGEAWDAYVHVDPVDPRFFRRDGEFYWPVGININAISDIRGLKKTPQQRLTPERGSLAYDAFLQRCAAVGIDSVEIWLSSFNLALEWQASWPEFRGLGRYNLANAQRLDRILDRAAELGITINLVVHNHGSASEKVDREWTDSPYNHANGGPFTSASQLFTEPLAKKLFAQHRRYLVGRWADHPALLGWKLWSEINLTMMRKNAQAWHQEAAAAWAELDPYQRPLTTHWAGDYRSVDRGVASLPGLDYICINGYLRRNTTIDEQLFRSTADRTRGLATLGKPILVTEYGGTSGGGDADGLRAHLVAGPFVALVAGHAGAPMTWWVEFVDQFDFWSPFIAIRRFAAGEDLRSRPGAPARSVRLAARADEKILFAAAWARPGRLLGYLVDRAWSSTGNDADAVTMTTSTIVIANDASPGRMHLEWWNADTGTIISSETLTHPGGKLVLTPPAWSRHLAWKLFRLDDSQ